MTSRKGTPRTADEKRREDFLGPLFNGNEASRKRIGLYALRTVGKFLYRALQRMLVRKGLTENGNWTGIVASPIRLVAEGVLFVPRLLWDVVCSIEFLSPYVENLPSPHSAIQSPTFRRLGNGHVYELYKTAAWGSRVVWDAPIVAYQYLLYVSLRLSCNE
jgi:hypothetical protein